MGKLTLFVVLTLAALSATCTAFALCGDTVIDAGEECDDGNTLHGDCCLPDCRLAAYAAPCGSEDLCDAARLGICDGAGACLEGETACASAWWCGGRLTLRDEPGTASDRLRVKSIGGRFGVSSFGITPERIGNPADETRYALCAYDTYMPEPGSSLVYGLTLAPDPQWEPASDGFVVRNGDRNPLRRATIRENRLRIVADGAALVLPGPVSATEYFNPRPRFFFVSDAGLCAQIGQSDETVRNTPIRFDSKAPCRAD